MPQLRKMCAEEVNAGVMMTQRLPFQVHCMPCLVTVSTVHLMLVRHSRRPLLHHAAIVLLETPKVCAGGGESARAECVVASPATCVARVASAGPVPLPWQWH